MIANPVYGNMYVLLKGLSENATLFRMINDKLIERITKFGSVYSFLFGDQDVLIKILVVIKYMV